MRWLMLCLLISLGALLAAAAAMIRHVRVHHTRLRSQPASRFDTHETDFEP